MLILLGAMVLLNRKLLLIFPFDAVTVNEPFMAVNNSLDEGVIVVDRSGQRLYKLNEKGNVEFLIHGERPGTNFYETKQLHVGPDGSIYVLDIYRTGGRRLKREKVLKYSSNGKLESVLCDVQYGEEEAVYKNKINRFADWNGTVAWFRFTDAGFDLVSETGVIRSVPFEDASQYLVDFAVNPVNQKISYLTKAGEIYSEGEDASFSLTFSVEGKEGYWIPWYLGYDEKGILSYADIGQRNIFQINSDQTPVPLLESGSMVFEKTRRPIYYNFDKKETLVTTDTHGILMVQEGNEASYITECPLSLSLKIRSTITWVSAFVVSAVLFVLALLAIYRIVHSHDQYLKRVAAMLTGTVLLTALFSMIILKDWTQRMTDEITGRTASVSKLSAMLIPGDRIKEIDEIGDYYGEDYQAIRDCARDIFVDDSKYINDLYGTIYRIQDGMITLMYGIEDYVGAIYPYDWPYDGSDEEKLMKEQIQKTYFGLSTSEGSFIFTLSPILDSEGNTVGIMEVGTDLYEFKQANHKMILEVIISAVVLAITMILITSELMIFQEGRKKRHIMLRSGVKKPPAPVTMLRLLVFLIFFVTNMPKGFLPVYIMKQAETEVIFGVSPAMLVSVALSAEVLFGAIFSFGGNVILRRIGRRKTALLGSILFVGGLSLRAVIPTIATFIVGNAVMGAGGGLLLLLVQIIIAEGSQEEKEEGFSGYTAASLSGVNCGVVFGAFLISWMSHRMVLVIIGIMSAATLVLSYRYLYDRERGGDKTETEFVQKPQISTLQFITSKRVLLYFVCIVIPVVAGGYFLAYLYPILGGALGISETNIGYSYLINGLCIICLGGALTKIVTNRLRKKGALISSAVLYAGAFILFALYPNVSTLLFSLVLLGISDGFGLPAQSTYYTDLEEVQTYGYDKAMGVYSLFENMSQVLGSFLFGIIYVNGVRRGLAYAGIIMLAASLVFLVFGGRKKHEEVK